MTGSIDLNPNHLAIVLGILAEHVPECEVRAFGSRASWTSRDYSDLDLAVVGEGKLHWRTLARLKEAFEESRLPMQVDVLDWHGISESFREMIEGEYVVVKERVGSSAVRANWKTKTLGEVADIIMGQSPPGDTVSSDHGVALLNGPTEFGAHHPTPVQFTTDARKRAHPGDLLFCVRGSTTGRMNWADQEYAIGRGVAAIRHRDEAALQPFVRGVIEGELPELLTQATGSTFPNVSAHQLAEIPYPNLGRSEQRAIAHVLGSLDDKIELNRRMNETLEAMARALFKSWFVDFDPVHAKMEDRWQRGESLPGLPADLYDLFPDCLVPSELGEIPEGWKVKALGNVADVSSGKRPKHRLPVANNEAQIPLWGGNGPMAFVPEPLVDFPILLTGRVGTLGSVFRITTPCWPSDNTLIVTAKSSHYFDFLFYQMEKIDFDALNRGSTQPLLTQSDLKTQPVILPPEKVLKYFANLTMRLFDAKSMRLEESRVLSAQRDALLPKLVSGDLRVKTLSKL